MLDGIGGAKRLFRQVAQTITPKAARPNALSVAEVATRNVALRAYQGKSSFEAVNARPIPDDGGGTPKTPDELRREAIDRAVATGEPQYFTNSDGKTEKVQIQDTGGWFDGDSVRVQVGDDSFTVRWDTDKPVDKNAILTQLVDSYSETPENYRTELHEVVITKDKYETDTGQGAAASAANGRITFYENGAYVQEGIFHHEMGHLIGRVEENRDDGFFSDWLSEPPPVPNGWDDAAKSDGNFVSQYAHDDYDVDHDYTEDFADSWGQYMAAVDSGPAAVEAFKQQYPARYAILEGLYDPA